MSEMCGMLSPEGIHSIHSKRQGIYPKGRDHIVHCELECVECGLECGLECGPECEECGPECEGCRVKRIKSSGVSNLICMGHTCWYLLVPARVPYIYFIWLRQTILFCFVEVSDTQKCVSDTPRKQRKIVWNVWNVECGMSGMSSECVECVECWRRGTCAGAQVYIPHIPEHSRHSWACLHSLYLSEANKIVWRGKMKSMGAPAGTCWYLLVPYI